MWSGFIKYTFAYDVYRCFSSFCYKIGLTLFQQMKKLYRTILSACFRSLYYECLCVCLLCRFSVVFGREKNEVFAIQLACGENTLFVRAVGKRNRKIREPGTVSQMRADNKYGCRCDRHVRDRTPNRVHAITATAVTGWRNSNNDGNLRRGLTV